MSTASSESQGTQGGPPVQIAPTGPVYAVVGFDGSEPSKHALDGAVRLLHGRSGAIDVVFVAHVPASAAMSATAVGEIVTGFEEEARRLEEHVRAVLEGGEHPFRFERRDGLVADELLAVADALHAEHGPVATVVLIIGRSAHKYHHVAGSVAHALEWQDRYPLVVLP